MENGIDEKIRSVLQNEEMMAKIADLIQNVAPSGPPKEQQAGIPAAVAPEPPAQQASLTLPGAGGSLLGGLAGNEAMTLLAAMRPFLRESRRSKLDAVSKAVAMAGVFRSAKRL